MTRYQAGQIPRVWDSRYPNSARFLFKRDSVKSRKPKSGLGEQRTQRSLTKGRPGSVSINMHHPDLDPYLDNYKSL